MPGIRLPDISLAGAVVAQVIPLTFPQGTYLPPSSRQNSQGISAYLRVWNESAVGLDYAVVGGTDTGSVPAGAWYDIELEPDVQQVNFTVSYLLPNPSVSLLKTTYYPAGRKPPPLAILGNSPVNGMVATSQSTTLVNTGNPSGTVVANLSDSPLTGAVQIRNDGTFTDSIDSNGTQTQVIGITRTGGGAGPASAIFGDQNGTNITQVYGQLNSTGPSNLMPGYQETGDVGFQGKAVAGGDIWGYRVNFREQMSNTPSSITLNASASTNCTASVGTINKGGFDFRVTATAGGAFNWEGTYTTVGN